MPRRAGTLLPNGLYYPLLQVTLTLTGQPPIPVLALVDSGADSTIFNVETLEPYGVDFDALDPMPGKSIGAGGTFERRKGSGEVRLGAVLICDEFQVAAAGSLPGPILGREDFFKKFSVKFNWHSTPLPTFDFEALPQFVKKAAPSKAKTRSRPKKTGRRR